MTTETEFDAVQRLMSEIAVETGADHVSLFHHRVASNGDVFYSASLLKGNEVKTSNGSTLLDAIAAVTAKEWRDIPDGRAAA